ncbi:MAG TPA: hypothetical protein VGN33_05190 [Leifsonia sp.]|jgi:hypothetical protein|nr:hypothetical protein [Leifsonia sp.]
MAAISIVFQMGGLFQQDAFELVRFDGKQWTPVLSPQIGVPAGTFGVEVDQLSCPSVKGCVIAGTAINAMGDTSHAWSAVTSGDGWRATVEPGLQSFDDLSCGGGAPCRALAEKKKGNALVTLKSDGSTTIRDLPTDSEFYALGCSSQLCAFSGPSHGSGGYLGTGSASSTTSAGADPSDRRLELGDPQTVACASARFCAAVGGYEGNSVDGTSYPLAEIFANNSWKATTPALPPQIKSGTLNGIACQSRMDCVAIGQTNGSVLP